MTTLTLDNVRGSVAEALVRVAAAREAMEASRSAFLRSVEDARAAGATNQEIGNVLGVSRQRVSQLLRKEEK